MILWYESTEFSLEEVIWFRALTRPRTWWKIRLAVWMENSHKQVREFSFNSLGRGGFKLDSFMCVKFLFVLFLEQGN